MTSNGVFPVQSYLGSRAPIMALMALQCVMQPASAKPDFSVVVSGTSDNNDGRTLDADASVSGQRGWQLGVGGGSTRSESSTSTLRSTSIRTFVEGQAAGVGLRGYYQYWHTANYALQTTGGRAAYTSGNLRLGITGEAKRLEVNYTIDPFTGQHDTARFTGSGWGANAGYRYQAWGAYISGTWYRYGALSSYVQTQISSSPPGAPPPGSGAPPGSSLTTTLGSEPLPPPDLAPPMMMGTPGLTGSLLALNQGVLNRQFAAGVLHNFARSSVYVDWIGAKDAIYTRTTNYYSTSYLYQFTTTFHTVATIGMSKSDSGSSTYGGLSLGVDF